jgi:integrase
MYSNHSGRANKGTVQIKVSNNRLQLVFRVGGKRHYLSTGFIDTPANRRLAEFKAREIEKDILYERFDPTLEKYKPESVLSTVTSVRSITPPKPSLADLWEKFIEYKRPQCSPNTMKQKYSVYTNYVKRLPTHDLDKAGDIRDFMVKNIPLSSAKDFLTRLSACCNWAIEAGAISSNPFAKMPAKIKVPKSQSEDEDVDPFTAEERDLIIAAFESDRFRPQKSVFKDSHYTSLIKFLFYTGCRPSEAVALQWKNISSDLRLISFQQALIETEDGRMVREGLKTQERRKFPCNDRLQALLASVKPEGCKPNALVFPSIEGTYINTNNLRNRAYKRILAGLGIQYRKLYQTRHTFITLALESGLDAKDVARLVGNSPEVIYRHYAGNKRDLFLPEF